MLSSRGALGVPRAQVRGKRSGLCWTRLCCGLGWVMTSLLSGEG